MYTVPYIEPQHQWLINKKLEKAVWSSLGTDGAQIMKDVVCHIYPTVQLQVPKDFNRHIYTILARSIKKHIRGRSKSSDWKIRFPDEIYDFISKITGLRAQHPYNGDHVIKNMNEFVEQVQPHISEVIESYDFPYYQ